MCVCVYVCVCVCVLVCVCICLHVCELIRVQLFVAPGTVAAMLLSLWNFPGTGFEIAQLEFHHLH